MQSLGRAVDPQTKYIESCLKNGQKYYPASRTICSAWPKMATKGQGKGKPQISKVCHDQFEYDLFMGAVTED